MAIEPGQAITLIRQMGLPWVVERVGYAMKQRVGWLAWRTPVRSWSHWRLERVAARVELNAVASNLLDASINPFKAAWGGRQTSRRRLSFDESAMNAVKRLDEIRSGRARLFESYDVEVGWPPNWLRHPDTGDVWPSEHWSRLPDFGASDVKSLWEIARFDIAYAAARAFVLTGDERHAETFWQLVESWRGANPPNAGPHWMCGQECAIRAIAWCFAVTVLADAPATSPKRIGMLVEMLAAHADRIEANLDFAISQRNNHGINEALGLFTIGTMFPALTKARHWAALGRRTLEREAARQIARDGAYVQHSLNYHRLVVQSLAWASRVAEIGGEPLSESTVDAFRRCVHMLAELTDESGRAPNYGSNDGGQLLHLDSCEFEDYRPTLALGFWAAEGRRVFDDGPWDEPLWWLCGDEPLEAEVRPFERASVASQPSGYVTLQGNDTWASTRCCTYESRPAQADMLHVDVWWRGLNLVADPGTYAYNGASPWKNGLAPTRVHNTVEADGLDQMRRGPRFTWFDWTESRVIRHEVRDDVKIFEGEHYGYRARLGIVHRRAVVLVGDSVWLVIDDVVGKGTHELSSQWLLPVAAIASLENGKLAIVTPAGNCTLAFMIIDAEQAVREARVDVVEPSESDTQGWFSTRYRQRKASVALVVREECELPVRRIAAFALGTTLDVSIDDGQVHVVTDRDAAILDLRRFPCDTGESLVRSFEGTVAASR